MGLLVLDVLVFVFGVLGASLIALDRKEGFLFFIAHSLFWGALSYGVGNYWAGLTCLIFIIIDIFGYRHWTKKGK